MLCSCSEPDLKRYIDNAVEVDPDRPVLVDKYMDRADELDVDALADQEGNVTICGIMQHIEQAGVHSGVLRWTPPLAQAVICMLATHAVHVVLESTPSCYVAWIMTFVTSCSM